jgi:hypothetical protein
MQCPKCDTDLRITGATSEENADGTLTHLLFSCLNPRCVNYKETVETQEIWKEKPFETKELSGTPTLNK